MSRHGLYEMDDWSVEEILQHGRYRGRVASALRGKRGQAFLRNLIAALEAMPIDKRELAADSFVASDGCMCALSATLNHKGLPQPDDIDFDDCDDIDTAIDHAAHYLNIAEVLAREVIWENDGFAIPNTQADQIAWRTRTFTNRHPPQYVRRKRWGAVLQWARTRLTHD